MVSCCPCIVINTQIGGFHFRRVRTCVQGLSGYSIGQRTGCCEDWKRLIHLDSYESHYTFSSALFTQTDMERLAKEVSTMLSFEHTNVMSLIGVCIDGEMPLLIMPFMSNGSVLEFVKHHRDELFCSEGMVYTRYCRLLRFFYS